ncbi:MAG: TolC family outer membrane protein [Arenibacterium sp.]
MKRWLEQRVLTRGFLAAGVVLALMAPGRVSAESLATTLADAYRNSGLIEQNRALLRAADEDVASAVSTLRPVVDFIVNARHVYSKSTVNSSIPRTTTNQAPLTMQLRAEWLLLDSGARSFGIQSAKETVLATRQALLSIEQAVLLRAVTAYISVLLTAENVALRNNNLRVLGEELRAAQDRFEVGEVTRTDVALAESRVAAARAELAFSRGEQVNARAEFVTAVGREPGNLNAAQRLPSPPASIDAAVQVAMRSHPDVRQAQHQVAATELRILQAQRTLGPTLRGVATAGVTNQLNSSGFSDDASLELSLRKRLYQGGSLTSDVRQAKANRDAARGNLLQVQRNVIQDVNQAFIRFQVAGASLVATRERVRAAQVAFDGIREEATLGARTTLDVLSAEQELLNALTAEISDGSEQAIAAFELLEAQGLLTAEKLKLQVQIYDPTVYYNLAKDAPAGVSEQSKQLDRVLNALGKR